MSEPVNLPTLQDRLDRLLPGDTVFVRHADFIRLFGTNDVALGRLSHFAKGHNCLATWSRSGLTLEKLSPPRKGKSDRP